MDQITYIILLTLFFAETGKDIELIQNKYLETQYTWSDYL